MSTTVRVAELQELPPGKGKVVEVGDRQVTVYNAGGTLRATCSRRARVHRAGEDEACAREGLRFDVFAEDSPAWLRADEEHVRVHVEEGAVYVEL